MPDQTREGYCTDAQRERERTYRSRERNCRGRRGGARPLGQKNGRYRLRVFGVRQLVAVIICLVQLLTVGVPLPIFRLVQVEYLLDLPLAIRHPIDDQADDLLLPVAQITRAGPNIPQMDLERRLLRQEGPLLLALHDAEIPATTQIEQGYYYRLRADVELRDEHGGQRRRMVGWDLGGLFWEILGELWFVRTVATVHHPEEHDGEQGKYE